MKKQKVSPPTPPTRSGMFYYSNPKDTVDFKGDMLLLPAVSIGHVGQLAMDVLINTLKAEKVATVHHPGLMALVGPNAFDESCTALTTSCEVFRSRKTRTTMVQIRTCVVGMARKDFLKQLLGWIKTQGFTDVVVIGSLHAYEMLDSQISDLMHRFVATPTALDKYKVNFTAYNWKELEQWKPGKKKPLGVSLPGGGFAKTLYDMCCEDEVSMVMLLRFASEGDNIPDALNLLDKLNQWIHLIPPEKCGNNSWIVPPSWKLLFGNPPPSAIF